MSTPAAAATLNDAQRAALDLSRDMLVSAGAGAGKTQVLGLRYLAILEEGLATVPEIVAFTFTDKAAAEMRQRVQELLLARIPELQNDSLRMQRLQQAQREFSLNRISTIHGYCHRLLRDFAWEAGLEPHAPILDERAQALARERAIRDVLFRSNEADRVDLTQALVRLGSVVRLFVLTDSLGQMLRDRAAVRGPLHRAAELWGDPDAEIARRRAHYEAQISEFVDATIAGVNAIDFATAGGAKDGDKLREQVFQLREAAKTRDLGTLKHVLLNRDISPSRPGGSKGNWKHDPDGLDRVRDQIVVAATALSAAGDLLDFQFDEAFERRVGRVACDLRVVFDELCIAYEQECAGGLDFLDLELRALKLLQTEPDVRWQAIRAARYMLIDEYQDTNPVQAELFSLLTDEGDAPGRFFAVGDSKQSIYAFRGSDVRVFNSALERVPVRNGKSGAAGRPLNPPWGLACEDTPERRSGIVRLEYNYRTVPPVLELGNEFFRKIFERDTFRDFDARPQDMLPGREAETKGAPVELHLLPDVSAGDETEYVAQLVERLHAEGTPYSDMTILVRRGTRNSLYRNAFARRNLPLLVVGEGGLFETQEALDCINLLRALANPGDDLAVLGLLRSPFAGLSDTQLTQLAFAANPKEPLLTRLQTWTDKPESAVGFLKRFERLRERAGRDAPALILGEAVSIFGYALAVGCAADADQRLANVSRMIELVRAMQHQLPSLAPLVRELRDRIERGEDESQGLPDHNVDGVRLMTIHKAKGLEFPVVILPDLGSDPRGGGGGLYRDLPGGADNPLGFYFKSLDEDDRGTSRGDYAAWCDKQSGKQRGLAEEKRVMYVAWTRAADRLLLVGSIKPGKDFDREVWAHQILRAAGVKEWGTESAHAALSLHWIDEVARSEATPHTPAIESIRKALKTGEIDLPAPIDNSLVAPIGDVGTDASQARDQDESRAGKLLHKAFELFAGKTTAEVGLLDARTMRSYQDLRDEFAVDVPDEEVHAQIHNVSVALSSLRPVRSVMKEFNLYLDGQSRRIDLLRDCGADQYEIVDYKTGSVRGDAKAYAESAYGEQLRGYARALVEYLNRRGREPKQIRLLVCFTAPDALRAEQRLVEIAPE